MNTPKTDKIANRLKGPNPMTEILTDLIRLCRSMEKAGNEMDRILSIPKLAPPEEWASELEIDEAVNNWRAASPANIED